jgi:hypothetical protein
MHVCSKIRFAVSFQVFLTSGCVWPLGSLQIATGRHSDCIVAAPPPTHKGIYECRFKERYTAGGWGIQIYVGLKHGWSPEGWGFCGYPNTSIVTAGTLGDFWASFLFKRRDRQKYKMYRKHTRSALNGTEWKSKIEPCRVPVTISGTSCDQIGSFVQHNVQYTIFHICLRNLVEQPVFYNCESENPQILPILISSQLGRFCTSQLRTTHCKCKMLLDE